jgi:very-short-patch-repair endonuclease
MGDGGFHRKTKETDESRDEYFRSIGYTVKRITHEEFKKRFFGE